MWVLALFFAAMLAQVESIPTTENVAPVTESADSLDARARSLAKKDNGKCQRDTLKGRYTFHSTGVESVLTVFQETLITKSISGSIYFDGAGSALSQTNGVSQSSPIPNDPSSYNSYTSYDVRDSKEAGVLETFRVWQRSVITPECTATLSAQVAEITQPIFFIAGAKGLKSTLSFGPDGDTFVFTQYDALSGFVTAFSGEARRVCNPDKDQICPKPPQFDFPPVAPEGSPSG